MYPSDTESLCFQLLGKSDSPEADRDRLEQFCCCIPIHMLGLGCFRSSPWAVLTLLTMAGFDKPLCTQPGSPGSRVLSDPFFGKGSRGAVSHFPVCSQQQGSEPARTKVPWVSRHCVVSARAASQDPLKSQQLGLAFTVFSPESKTCPKTRGQLFCWVSQCHIPGYGLK